MCHWFFIQSSVLGHSGCFTEFTYQEHRCIFWLHLFGFLEFFGLRYRIAGSDGNLILSFYTIFQKDWTRQHLHQQCCFSPHIHADTSWFCWWVLPVSLVWGGTSFWFVFSLWLVLQSSFLCTYCPSVCLLYENVCSFLLIFDEVHCFFLDLLGQYIS